MSVGCRRQKAFRRLEVVMELVFELFVQSRRTKTGAGGTGLGLSLAQSFVSQHDGLIEFDSVPGRTRFTILLPVRTAKETP